MRFDFAPVAALTLAPLAASAQQPLRDTLRLPALTAAAAQGDPRQQQLRLHAVISALRLKSIDAERFPSFTIDGLAQYQSDVVGFPFQLPGGQPTPVQPHETYDARVNVREPLFDPTAGPRRAAERAQRDDAQAQVRTTLFAIRQEVTEAFFTAAAFDARANEFRATLTDLEGRRREAGIRVREGISLPSDTASLDAMIIQRREDEADQRANQRAALARLAQLVGRSLDETDAIALPDLAAAAAEARRAFENVRARPEYAQFVTARERAARDLDLVLARSRPMVSAFARVGYGKPGLDFLSNRFDAYWISGIQFQWAPVMWGTTDRAREALVAQQQIIATNEAAFTESVRRAVQTDLQAMDRLETSLAADERVIALREQVERETGIRLQEGVVTAADYVARSAEVLQARLTRASHRVALAQARAHFLTILGLEVR